MTNRLADYAAIAIGMLGIVALAVLMVLLMLPCLVSDYVCSLG